MEKVKQDTIRNCFNKAFNSKDNNPCALLDIPCPIVFGKDVFEAHIDMETSFNSNIATEDDEEDVEERKTGINNAVSLVHLHDIRLCLESANAKEEFFNEASLLEKFFVKKSFEETRGQSKITDSFKSL